MLDLESERLEGEVSYLKETQEFIPMSSRGCVDDQNMTLFPLLYGMVLVLRNRFAYYNHDLLFQVKIQESIHTNLSYHFHI